ncbi:MAG: 50S ribosomal protein L1 [bacterium]
MAKVQKRLIELTKKLDRAKTYPVDEALVLVKESPVKFDASVEVHFRLGIDPAKGEQVVRGTVVLPHGTGKQLKVAAFVGADKEKEAREAGADLVGGDDLINQIKTTGKTDFDVAVATPDMMKPLAAIAKTLGQKGLMPNPKTGTVTMDVGKTIGELKKGRVNFKNDATANIHQVIGKVSFTNEQLKENFLTLFEAVKKGKPETSKGTYLKKVTICSTMGPGIAVGV